MAEKIVKKVAAKKTAPVAKKAVAKRAVAKKAAPVAKKAVAKKAVAKKAAPITKKAVTKKTVAKKAAPVAKKAAPITKKAAPVAKKAVAKKTAPRVRKSPSVVTSKNDLTITTTQPIASSKWITEEQELPAFLKEVSNQTKIEPISTQVYSKRKSRKAIILTFTLILVFLATAVLSMPSKTRKVQNNALEVVSSQTSPKSEDLKVSESKVNKATPKPSSSVISPKPVKSEINSLAPRNFKSLAKEQAITFSWIAPKDPSLVIGYELSVKKSGSSDWIVISSVTPQQLEISVDLVSLDSTSEFRIASILESGKLAFSSSILSLPGTVE